MIKTEKESPNVGSMKYEDSEQCRTGLYSRKMLWSRLNIGIDARARFVESNLDKNIAFQIRAIRDRSGLSQIALAEKVGMNQNAISRLENPLYGKATLTTLKRIAAAFDVGLMVKFVPYGHLVDWISGTEHADPGLSPDSLVPPSFSDEAGALDLGKMPGLSELKDSRLGCFQKPVPEGAGTRVLPGKQVA